MRKVYYGEDGDLVNLRTFVERQGPDPNKWTLQPICKGCGRVVTPINVKVVLGFSEVSEEVAQRAGEMGRKPQAPHFRHKDGEGEGCPYDDRKDPLFAPFHENEFDIRARERVRDVLFSPEVKAMNGAMMRMLYWHLTGKWAIPDGDGKAIWRFAEKRVCSMSVLIQRPWIFPFAQILFAGARDAYFKGVKTPLQFLPMGKQAFEFRDFEGRKRHAELPQGVGLYFASNFAEFRSRGQDRQHVRYELSEQGVIKIAEASRATFG